MIGSNMESTRRKLMKEQGKYLIKIILVLLVFHTFNASFFFLKKKNRNGFSSLSFSQIYLFFGFKFDWKMSDITSRKIEP